MEDKIYIPVHQTLKVGMMLAVVGGFLDAYTYLLQGRVFANAQTGNLEPMSRTFLKNMN